MDLEERVPDLDDPTNDRLARPVAMLGSPGLVALPRLVVAARSIGGPRVLDDPEEAVLGAEHVLDDRAHRPLVLLGRTVEIAVTHPREGAGQVAVCPVVLAEDALGLRDGGPSAARSAASRTARSRSSCCARSRVKRRPSSSYSRQTHVRPMAVSERSTVARTSSSAACVTVRG